MQAGSAALLPSHKPAQSHRSTPPCLTRFQKMEGSLFTAAVTLVPERMHVRFLLIDAVKAVADTHTLGGEHTLQAHKHKRWRLR